MMLLIVYSAYTCRSKCSKVATVSQKYQTLSYLDPCIVIWSFSISFEKNTS